MPQSASGRLDPRCYRLDVDALTGYLTAFGLSTAAGLNAYIPLLTVGLLSRYTDLIDLPSPWDGLGDPIVLVIVGVVGVADFIGDKVPIVDHVLHVIGTVVAPVVGGVLALASASAFDLRSGVAATLGIAAALATQLGRTAARPVSTAATGGGGNPVVSLGEDGVSGTLSVTSVIAPWVAAVLAVLVLVAIAVFWGRWRRFGLRIQGRQPPAG
jgi:Domain of unknown function (DUF4126)